MSFPFGGHPKLAEYIVWLQKEHQGASSSGYSQGEKPQSMTRLSLPDGTFVVVVGTKQSEFLAPSVVGFLDRRLGVKSPWFSVDDGEA